nr:multiple inositol polyphosphate phosphatase 1-like [Penaeus vannamei]
MSETPLENFPFVLTENINMSRILMDSVTKKKGKDKVYCLSEDDEPYTGFALLTPYRSGSSMDVKAEDVIPSGCNPVILWHLVRHGSNGPHMIDRRRFDRRLPVLRKQILKSHKDQQGYLCDKDVALINGWKPTDMLYGDATLSDEGKEEMTGIASRFRNAFSGFLKKDYFNLPGIRPGKGTKRNFGNGQHNMRSMKAYNKGMYGKYARFVVLRGMPARFLEYFDHCPNYIREVMQLDKKLKPYHGFMSGSYMKLVLENVAKRVGFAVSVTDVRSMYNTCRYYYAWYKDKVSPWCSVFTPDDLKILEYWEDLRVYSDQGPVYEITSKQACELGKEVMDLFGNRLKNNSAEPYLTQYIVNYETLVTFITLMGIFSEQERLDENRIPDSRVWKTTEFAGYGGNLALFLSSCGDDSFWVSALVNERPIQLPGCNSTLGCTWDEFAQYYDYLNDCDFSEICGSLIGINLSKARYWHDQAKQKNWS